MLFSLSDTCEQLCPLPAEVSVTWSTDVSHDVQWSLLASNWLQTVGPASVSGQREGRAVSPCACTGWLSHGSSYLATLMVYCVSFSVAGTSFPHMRTTAFCVEWMTKTSLMTAQFRFIYHVCGCHICMYISTWTSFCVFLHVYILAHVNINTSLTSQFVNMHEHHTILWAGVHIDSLSLALKPIHPYNTRIYMRPESIYL